MTKRSRFAATFLLSGLCWAGISGCIGLPDAEVETDDGTLAGRPDAGTTPSQANGLPAPYRGVYNVTSIYVEGASVVIRTKDLPDHKSPFYAQNDSHWEAYNGSNPKFSTAINLMGQISDPDLRAQDITFRLPLNPVQGRVTTPTSGGAIGIALNGVVIFNQYNGMRALLDTLEFNNFDQYNGHPTPAPSQQYHYHVEPLWLTKTLGSSALVGFLLDGFPIYGPVENGKRLKSADLDRLHGHSHATAEYPQGIYHYHFTDDAPWLNGDGFYGTPGTVTR